MSALPALHASFRETILVLSRRIAGVDWTVSSRGSSLPALVSGQRAGVARAVQLGEHARQY